MSVPPQPDKLIGFNIRKVHFQAFILTLAAILAGFVFLIIFHSKISFSFSIWSFTGAVILYILLIVLHEAFHLLGFVIWGKCQKADLIYGINSELGVAYAGTKKTLSVKAMRKALMLPFWITGLLPFLIGIWLNSKSLMIVSSFLIGGAAGDFSMYFQLRKLPKSAFILDDATKPILYVYNKKPEQK